MPLSKDGPVSAGLGGPSQPGRFEVRSRYGTVLAGACKGTLKVRWPAIPLAAKPGSCKVPVASLTSLLPNICLVGGRERLPSIYLATSRLDSISRYLRHLTLRGEVGGHARTSQGSLCTHMHRLHPFPSAVSANLWLTGSPLTRPWPRQCGRGAVNPSHDQCGISSNTLGSLLTR